MAKDDVLIPAQAKLDRCGITLLGDDRMDIGEIVDDPIKVIVEIGESLSVDNLTQVKGNRRCNIQDVI